MTVLPVGDAALLVEVDGLPEVLALADAVRAAPLPGVLDVVPAARTVLLVLAPGTDLGTTRRAVLDLPVAPDTAAAQGDVVQIDVVYDGPDLDEVARLTGLDADGVVRAHTADRWRVAFGGFAPGFAYLVSGDSRWTFRAGTSRGPPCRPGRWDWPASSAGCTRARRRVAGS